MYVKCEPIATIISLKYTKSHALTHILCLVFIKECRNNVPIRVYVVIRLILDYKFNKEY